MFGTRWSWVAVLGFALAACSHSRPATRSASTGAATAAQQGAAAEQGAMDERCPGPMAMQGTKVTAEDTPSGEALTFTTAGDVDELRRRVHEMADMHNAHHGADASAGESGTGAMHGDAGAQGGDAETSGADRGGGMMGGMHHGGMGGGMGGMHGGMAMPDSTASVEDVDGGARVYVTPKDPAKLEELRDAVRTHVEHMQMAGCGTRSGTGMNEGNGAGQPELGDRT